VGNRLRPIFKTSLKKQAKHIEKRKAELGLVGFDYVPVNAGGRRTPEKRAALRRLARVARERGEGPKFKANI
jgi:hypothetical protein